MGVLLLTLAVFVSGCSSLHVHKGYYLPSSQPAESVKRYCEESGSYGDVAVVDYGEGAKLEVFVGYKRGFTFLGPMYFPIFPIFWVGGSSTELWLRVNLRGPIKHEYSSLQLNMNDSPHWIRPENRDEELLAKCQSKENLEKRQAGQTNYLVCPPEQAGWIRFKLPEGELPDRLVLRIDGVHVKGKAQEEREVPFKQRSNWHYDPFIVLHSEWPYTSQLPCAR